MVTIATELIEARRDERGWRITPEAEREALELAYEESGLSRTIFVLRPVSSIKTSRPPGHCGWALRHRLRAAFTSGRACSAACVVFFVTQAHAIEPVPERRQTDLDLEFLQTALLQFHQSQICLPGDPSSQPLLMLFQPRLAVAANLLRPAVPARAVLVPKRFHAAATHPKAPANLPGARAATMRWRKSSLNGPISQSSCPQSLRLYRCASI
jgi:hypothetical protein